MHKVTISAALLVAGLIGCGTATAGGRGGAALVTPTIIKTAIDTQENALIITGRNFGATAPL